MTPVILRNRGIKDHWEQHGVRTGDSWRGRGCWGRLSALVSAQRARVAVSEPEAAQSLEESGGGPGRGPWHGKEGRPPGSGARGSGADSARPTPAVRPCAHRGWTDRIKWDGIESDWEENSL